MGGTETENALKLSNGLGERKGIGGSDRGDLPRKRRTTKESLSTGHGQMVNSDLLAGGQRNDLKAEISRGWANGERGRQ